MITGGAGYIGSYLSFKLSKNYDVIIIDNLTTGNIKNVKYGKFYKVDILDFKKLNFIFEKNKIDIVLHLAALVKIDESLSKPKKYLNTNLIGTSNILRCMQKFKVNNIIFASTAAVYMPSKKKLNENDKIKLTNTYAEAKYFSEKLIKIYTDLFNMKSVIFRFFNVSGADHKAKIGERVYPPTHFITILLNNLLRNKFTRVHTGLNTPDQSGIRDYIHVKDICSAFEKVIKSYMVKTKFSEKIFEIFNLGTGIGSSTYETVSYAKKIIKDKNFKIIDGKKRPGDQPIVVCDYKKIKKRLNWRPLNSSLRKIIISSYIWEKSLINEK